MIVRGLYTDYHFFSAWDIVSAPPFCYSVNMAKERKRVVVLGDTVFLSGIQASLVAYPGLEVFNLERHPDRSFEELSRLCPDAIIFDMGAMQHEFPLSFLQQLNLLLIGINPETHQALVWSGRQAEAVVASDLVNVIFSNYKNEEKM